MPRPDAYGVAVAVLGSESFAAELAHGLRTDLRARAITVDGIAAGEIVGSEKSFPHQNSESDPTASEGFLILDVGRTVFVVLAVTDSESSTRAFLGSFRTG